MCTFFEAVIGTAFDKFINATSKFRPRPEKRSVPDVLLEAWVRSPLLHGQLLQDGDAADVTQQEPDEERRRHTQVLVTLHH